MENEKKPGRYEKSENRKKIKTNFLSCIADEVAVHVKFINIPQDIEIFFLNITTMHSLKCLKSKQNNHQWKNLYLLPINEIRAKCPCKDGVGSVLKSFRKRKLSGNVLDTFPGFEFFCETEAKL